MTFLDEIVNKLVAAGVVHLGTSVGDANSIYAGSKVTIPSGDGPLLSIIETGGSEAVRTQNGFSVERPSAQLLSRGASLPAARTLLKNAYDALGGADGLHNVVLSGTWYLNLIFKQQITDIGLDQVGRVMVSINIDAERAIPTSLIPSWVQEDWLQ